MNKEDGRIAIFFWIDGQSIMDYKCFGDAVSFDTKFEMPFAPILGTNHHKQTIIFGCALLFNETIKSFVCLFETFLTAMSQKHPSTIFTNQDAAMASTIDFVFPNTSHSLCLWHIYLNATKRLGHVIHASENKSDEKLDNKSKDKSDNRPVDNSDNKFLADFKRCIYEDRSETYFI